MNNNDAKHMNNDNNKNIVLIIVEIILIAIASFSLIKIILWLKDNKESKEILENISTNISIQIIEDEENENIEQILVDFQKLREINPDTVSYIKIENTNIEYPIVKAKDNDYYLNHSFDKKITQQVGYLWITKIRQMEQIKTLYYMDIIEKIQVCLEH